MLPPRAAFVSGCDADRELRRSKLSTAAALVDGSNFSQSRIGEVTMAVTCNAKTDGGFLATRLLLVVCRPRLALILSIAVHFSLPFICRWFARVLEFVAIRFCCRSLI